MLSIKIFLILATILVSLSSVFAVESSSSAGPNDEVFAVEGVARLLMEEKEHSHDEKFGVCHCGDRGMLHCFGEGAKELEATCVCKDGEALCGEEYISAGISSRMIGSATTIAAMATVVAIAL